MADWDLASSLLDRFENGEIAYPADAERLIAEVFRACGHAVFDTGFVESERGADLFLETRIEGARRQIAVEVKYRGHAAERASIAQLLAMRESQQIDRVLVVSRAGFTVDALRLAQEKGVGLVDLQAPRDLRNWLTKHAPQAERDGPLEQIIREAMRAIARHIAEVPQSLADVEWRDLERVLREVFDGLGFDTKLTRSGKDGGFDLELTIETSSGKNIYLVEVKHWSKQKPGPKHLDKLVEVTASRGAASGLLLSTSGFTRTFYQGLATTAAPVRIGDGGKVAALCQTYVRLGNALWTREPSLEQILFEGTRPAGGGRDRERPEAR